MDHPTDPAGATVVITHRVRDGMHDGYERWLSEIGGLCRAAEGHLDWQIVRPIPALSAGYTVIIRFDTVEHLTAWMGSTDRERLIREIQPLLQADDAYTIHSGLDFLFMPQAKGPKVPVRWKQFLVTWSAICPLAISVPLAIVPALRLAHLPANRVIDAVPTTACIVFVMIYVVMPHYSRLVRKWLFSP